MIRIHKRVTENKYKFVEGMNYFHRLLGPRNMFKLKHQLIKLYKRKIFSNFFFLHTFWRNYKFSEKVFHIKQLYIICLFHIKSWKQDLDKSFYIFAFLIQLVATHNLVCLSPICNILLFLKSRIKQTKI